MKLTHCTVILLFLLAIPIGCSKPPNIQDLGGTQLAYTIQEPEQPFDKNAASLKLRQRLDPLGKAGIQVAILGNELEVLVPAAEGVDVGKLKKLVTAKANLELLILTEVQDRKLSDFVEAAEAAGQLSSMATVEVDGQILGRWIPIAAGPELAIQFDANHLTRDEDGKKHILCNVSKFDISSQHFDGGSKGLDDRQKPVINFLLTDVGATNMAALTSANIGRRLAIVFDGHVVSAPTIQSTIQDRGQISGQFNEQEIDELVSIMAAGPLPFAFVSESPQVTELAPKQ